MPPPGDELSLGQARRIALSRPGSAGTQRRRRSARPCCGASARSNSTPFRYWPVRTSWSPTPDTGAVGRAAVERAYWGQGSATFEYWSHAACVIPLEDWPLYGFKRRARRAKGKRWHVLEDRDRSCNEVMARLRGRRAPDRQRAGRGQEVGSLVGLVRDENRRRVAARRRRPGVPGTARVPAGLRPGRAGHSGPRCAGASSATRSVPCAWWPRPAVRSASATRRRPGRLPRPAPAPGPPGPPRDRVGAGQGARAGSLWPMPIRPLSAPWAGGPRGGACCSPPSTPSVGTGTASSGSSECATDWRPTRRGHKRTYGYFAMPVLGDTEIVGLVDPGRRDGALVAKQVTLFAGRGRPTTWPPPWPTAAQWVGCDRVIVERVDPDQRSAEPRDARAGSRRADIS